MDPSLLRDMMQFLREVAAGGWELVPAVLDDDDDDPVVERPGWAPVAEALLLRARRLVESGSFEDGGRAIERFLRAWGGEGSESFGGDYDLPVALRQPAHEVFGQHLRCVLDRAPRPERAERLVAELDRYRLYGSSDVRLRDVLAASPASLPADLDDLLVRLPHALEPLVAKEEPQSELAAHRSEHALALQREAVALREGVGALRDLVASDRRHRRAGALDLVEALARSGDLREAADACREGLAAGSDWSGAVAHLGDRLSELGDALGDATAAADGARAAWRHAPTTRRLVRLAVAGAPGEAELARRMREEAAHVVLGYEARVDRAVLLFVGGLLEEAVEAAEENGSFLGGGAGTDATIVVTALLSALAPLRPARGTHLRRQWLFVKCMMSWCRPEDDPSAFAGGSQVPWHERFSEDDDVVAERLLAILARRRPSPAARAAVLDALVVACGCGSDAAGRDGPWPASRLACAEALELVGRREEAIRIRSEAFDAFQ